MIRTSSAKAPDSASIEVLEGEVVRVTYQNDTSGFRVLRVSVDGQGGLQTVVGVFPAAPPGTRIRATGSREHDGRHGEQFKAQTLLPLAPSTREGLQRYLASGLVPGIGPAFARRVVETFGDATMEVLDHHPDRLREVPGLGKRRVAAIADAWKSHRAVGAIMVFLQSHGASPALAMRIYERFGERAAAIVAKSPFRLALDVWGIGFKTADTIARSIGVAEDAPERLQAGVLQLLHDFSQRGHVYAPQELLLEASAEMLSCDLALLDDALASLANEERVQLEALPDASVAVYLPELWQAERRVASRLTDLTGDARHLEGVGLAIAKFQEMAGFELAPNQRAAIEQVARNKVVVVTGGPGVGKTTLVRAILALFDTASARVALAAPTGRAAKRLSEATGRPASTIHRLLEFEPKGGTFQRNRENPIEADALVVDESSMLALLLADPLLQAIPEHARLVLVGDVDQLPSVGPGAVLADIISSGRVATVCLNQVFRQAEGSAIVDNAHLIHDGKAPQGATAPGEEFYLIQRSDPEAVAQLITELLRERIPRGFGLSGVDDVQVLTPMQRGATGAIALNAGLQQALNPDGAEVRKGNRILRQGDKVMQLRNNYDKDVFNGDLGRITRVDPEERSLTVSFEGREIGYRDAQLDELSLAYATTIHKSQGSEYPAVVVPVLTQHFVMLSRNLLYTAVTRGKRLVILIADPRALSIALAETRKEDRRTLLGQRLIAESER